MKCSEAGRLSFTLFIRNKLRPEVAYLQAYFTRDVQVNEIRKCSSTCIVHPRTHRLEGVVRSPSSFAQLVLPH